jgi:hypothetical protein
MRLLLVLFATGLLGICLAACGSADKGASPSTHDSAASTAAKTVAVSTVPSHAPPAPVQTKTDADKDNDSGAIAADEKNNSSVLDLGHAASASDQRAIAALIKRYYAAALAENGAKACSMLYSTIAESVPEDYGISPPSQPYMRGTTCPAVLTLLFKHYHPQIALEYPKLEVARVRLVEHQGIAVLHFGALPERQISVGREGHTWKLKALLDGAMP